MTTVDPADLIPLETGCEWRAGDIGDDYVVTLTDAHVAELDAALIHAEAVTDDVLDVTRADFPLPTLTPELAHVTDELINGNGVVLIRGLPAERYSKERASSIYWGVGTHLGEPWPQNA
ncbi:MAG TPA: taurine catabolism dioxygenase TauD, partial [Acidimicrobiales bacterium]